MTIPTIRARQTSESDNYCPVIPLITIHPPLRRILYTSSWYLYLNHLSRDEARRKHNKMLKAIEEAGE